MLYNFSRISFTNIPISKVIDLRGKPEQKIELEIRSTNINSLATNFRLDSFSHDLKGDILANLNTLEQIYSEPTEPKKLPKTLRQKIQKQIDPEAYRRAASRVRRSPKKSAYERKLERIKEALDLGLCKINQVARHARCTNQLVKQYINQVQVAGNPPEDHNKLRSRLYKQQIENTINLIDNPFMTCSDLMRRSNDQNNLQMSLTTTRKNLKRLGYLWTRKIDSIKTMKAKKKLEEERNQFLEKLRFIGSISQLLLETDIVVLFLDQIKIPISQFTNCRWKRRKSKEEIIIERDSIEIILTCNVLCTEYGFLSIAITEAEITAKETIYFLNESIKLVKEKFPGKEFAIIADNAPWQKCRATYECWFSKHILYSPKGCPYLNFIEMTFSAVRYAWKKRSVKYSKEENINQLVEIFFNQNKKQNFKGYCRNYIRTLKSVAAFGEEARTVEYLGKREEEIAENFSINY